MLFAVHSELPSCVNGSQAIGRLGYETSSVWVWYDVAGLVGLILIFLFFTYLALRTMKKLK